MQPLRCRLWALPVTLAGRLVARLGGCSYLVTWRDARVYVPASARSLLLRLFFRRFPQVAAFTWGHVIVVQRLSDAADTRLLAHEYQHARQAGRWGPLFPLAYGVASLLAHLSEGEAYRDNAFEVEARAVALREVPPGTRSAA